MKKNRWLSLFLILVLTNVMSGTALAEGDMVPGTYTGTGTGRAGDIVVSVTVDEASILSIDVIESHDTPGISDYPLTSIPADVVKFQSLNIDGLSGATLTSFGVKRAIADALTQAGADASEWQKREFTPDVVEVSDMTTQVVVAGGGMSGLMTALTAAHEGAQVVLIEKKPYLGGSLLIAGGGILTLNSEDNDPSFNDEIEHTIDYVKALNANATHEIDYGFLSHLMNETGPAVDYLGREFSFPVEYMDMPAFSFSRIGSGADYAKLLEAQAREEGVTVLTNTTVTEILMDGDVAIGVKAVCGNQEFTVSADSVVITTGGANYDNEMMLAANPTLETVRLYNEVNTGNTGDGYKMLEAVGALMGDGPRVKQATPDFSPVFAFTWANNPTVTNLLMIDAEGRRFTNESPDLFAGNQVLTQAMIDHGSNAYYAIYDGANIDPDLKALFDARVGSKSIVVYADTIEALAEQLEMEASVLKETFEAYQAAASSGVDEAFGKPADSMTPYVEDSGFYAAYLMPGTWGTFGGAITDYSMRVMKQDGTVFDNLYAAGECATSTLFGDYYIGSFSLGLYTAQGKIIGQTVASVKQ